MSFRSLRVEWAQERLLKPIFGKVDFNIFEQWFKILAIGILATTFQITNLSTQFFNMFFRIKFCIETHQNHLLKPPGCQTPSLSASSYCNRQQISFFVITFDPGGFKRNRLVENEFQIIARRMSPRSALETHFLKTRFWHFWTVV